MGQKPKEPSRGVQQNGKNRSHTIFIAKVINKFLRSFSTWTDFSTVYSGILLTWAIMSAREAAPTRVL